MLRSILVFLTHGLFPMSFLNSSEGESKYQTLVHMVGLLRVLALPLELYRTVIVKYDTEGLVSLLAIKRKEGILLHPFLL